MEIHENTLPVLKQKGIPVISVIILYWNSAQTFPDCLASLAAQTYSAFEVIVIDNGSKDGGAQDISRSFPQLNLRLVRLPENKGFATANNIGARLARGRWLALLNADAFATPDWLASLVDATKRHPEFACFASRLIQSNDHFRLDGAGDVYHISGLAWRRYYGEPVDSANIEEEVFSPSGAAAFYTRDAFLSVGGFDEDYFCYHEDVDLGFRLRLQGYRCLYIPQAIVYHVGSTSHGKKSNFVIYHGHRNLVWTYVRNMPATLFWRYLFTHLFIAFVYLIYYSLSGNAVAIWRAKVDAVRGLHVALRKRHETQQLRRIDARDLDRLIDHSWTRFWRSYWRPHERVATIY